MSRRGIVKKSFPSVAVLFNVTEHLAKGQPQDMLAERSVIACAQAVSEALEAAGCRVAQVPVRADLERDLAPYPPNEWVVFNLGEGLEGRLFEEARIAWALEAMGYRFTGAGGDAIALSVHKGRAKLQLHSSGVTTPGWRVFRHPNEVDGAALEPLSFPLIVKPIAEDASLGVGPDAVVSTIQALRERVAYVVNCYRQAALAEAFIVGREFNIALWGDPPETLPVAEIDFSAFGDPFARIVSFAAKWDETSFDYCHMPVHCPAPVEHGLGDYLAGCACQAWTSIGCRNYARVDLRVSDEGIPYVMEVNCNPDLSPDAGFYRSARAAGYSYQTMVVHILELALRQPSTYDRDSYGYRWPLHLGTNGYHQRLRPNGSKLRRRAMERVSG
jgi:D-alanine-D-alanine ligase